MIRPARFCSSHTLPVVEIVFNRTDHRLVGMPLSVETPVIIPVSTQAASICVLDVTGLRAALDGLTASSEAAARLTVAALAREAGVGRNAIYANHRDVLGDLVRARGRQRQRSPDNRPSADDRFTEQRRLIDDMQQQVRQLATENAGLLRRAIEAERRADRAERRSAQLTKEIGNLQRPTMLRSQQESSMQG